MIAHTPGNRETYCRTICHWRLRPGFFWSVMEMYDPATDTWEKKANVPRGFGNGGFASVDGKIYVSGRVTQRGGVPLSTFFEYDPATDTWTVKEPMPVRMTGMGTSTVDGKVYVIGGTSAGSPYSPFLSTVWEYNPGFAPVPPEEAVPVEEAKSVEPRGKLIMLWGKIKSE